MSIIGIVLKNDIIFIDIFYFFGVFHFQDISGGGLLIDGYLFEVYFSNFSLDKQYNKANLPYDKCSH